MQMKLLHFEKFNRSCSTTITSGFFHIYLCLDDSGSMRGRPWSELTVAVKSFIAKRLDYFHAESINPGDTVTIINYSTNAKVMCRNIPINGSPEKYMQFRGGGTSFKAGLSTVYNELKSLENTKIPVLLFMSDGGSFDGNCEMELISKEFSKAGIKIFTIGFGSECNKKKLEDLALIGGGKFFFGVNGLALKSEFETISTELCASQFNV